MASALVICEGYPAGAPMLGRAVSAFRGADVSREEGLRWLWLACRAALIVWDYESWTCCPTARSTLARDAGALIMLPIAFNMRSQHSVRRGVHRGRLAGGGGGAVTEATGSSIAPYGAVALAACRGREAEALELIETAPTTRSAGVRAER